MEVFEKYFTITRLKRYSIYGDDRIKSAYEINILLSKELYPLLAIFEVSFRNAINNAINENIKVNWLMDSAFIANFLEDKELRIYNDVCKDLKRKGKLNADNVVASLNLGFWVYLFSKKYKVKIWHKKNMFEHEFKNYDIKMSNRIAYQYPLLKEIQLIRNRISHHESVFDYKNGIDNFYMNLLKCIYWISEDLMNECKKLSKFEDLIDKKR
jgi:hypothetical protein